MYQITLISTAQQKEAFCSIRSIFYVAVVILFNFLSLFIQSFILFLLFVSFDTAYTKRSAMITWFIFEIVNRMTTTEQQQHHDFKKYLEASNMFILKTEDDIDLTSERVRCVFIYIYTWAC